MPSSSGKLQGFFCRTSKVSFLILSYFILSYFILYYIILYYIILYYIILYYIILYYIILYYIILYYLILSKIQNACCPRVLSVFLLEGGCWFYVLVLETASFGTACNMCKMITILFLVVFFLIF